MGDVNIGNTGGFYEHTYVQAGTLPSANADLLTTRISPIGSTALFRIDFCPTVAGVLTATFLSTDGNSTSSSTKLIGGSSLTANALMPTELLVSHGETVNFQFSGTGGSYRLVVREV